MLIKCEHDVGMTIIMTISSLALGFQVLLIVKPSCVPSSQCRLFTSSHMVVRKDYETYGAPNPSNRSICYNRDPSAAPLAFKRHELCLIYNIPSYGCRHAELLPYKNEKLFLKKN